MTMKKIYQQPELFACELGSAAIIAQTDLSKKIVVDPTKTVDDEAANFAKDSHTDLWSDDW